jgi:hypothetical protein
MSDLLSVAEQTLHYLRREHVAPPTSPVAGAAAWRAHDLRTSRDWIVDLTSEQIDELETAYARVASLPLAEIQRDDFALPKLGDEIRRWAHALMHGRGVLLVRGLPVERWGEQTASTIYWGIGRHLGRPGAQNELSELLGHVRDTGEAASDPNVRLYKTAADIAFHCDAADVVGLLCLRTARSGGVSRIASSVAIWNELHATHPKLAARLFDPVQMDVRSENEGGGLAHFPIPPCRFADGRLRTFYHSDYFRSVVRHADVAQLSALEQELFDAYEAIANSPEFFFDMELTPGDLQLISNHSVVHSRTSYEDPADPAQRRHLLRLWLSITD